MDRQTGRDVDQSPRSRRGCSTVGSGVEHDGEFRAAHVDVFADHQRSRAGGGRPVDQARVVAGDVLAHRHEPGQRVGGGAAQHRFVLDRTARRPGGRAGRTPWGGRRRTTAWPVRRVPTVSQNGSIRSMSSGPTSNTPRRRVGIVLSIAVAECASDRTRSSTRISSSSQRSMMVARPDRKRVGLCSRYTNADRVAAGDPRRTRIRRVTWPAAVVATPRWRAA